MSWGGCTPPEGEPGGGLPAGVDAGDILQFDGSEWVPNAEGPPAIGDMLIWDGSSWVPGIEPHEVIYYPAIGGGADDSAALQAFINTWAGIRQVSLVKGNIYQIDATITLPSQTYLRLNGATINTNIAGTYPLTGSTFRTGRGTVGTVTTIAAGFASGLRTVPLASVAGMAVGGFIALASAVTGKTEIYKIESIAGSTLTLERATPKRNGFAVADSAAYYGPNEIPTEVVINGEGARIVVQGGVVTISLQAARFSRVHDIRFESTATGPSDAFGIFNDGAYSCEAWALDCDGTAKVTGSLLGLGMQSGEANVVRDSTVRNVTGYALAFIEAYRCTFQRCQSSGSNQGLTFGNDTGLAAGSDYCHAVECTCTNHNAEGIYAFYGSGYNTIERCEVSNNGTVGIRIGDGVNNGPSNKVIGCNVANSGSQGIRVGLATKGTQLVGNDIKDSIGDDILLDDEVWIDSLRITSAGVNTSNRSIACNQPAGVQVFINNFSITRTAAAAAGLIKTFGGKTTLTNGWMSLGTNGDLGIWDAAAQNVDASNVRVFPAGGATGTYGWYTQNAMCRLGDSVDLSACATPFAAAGGVFNFGVLVAGGAGAAQAVAFAGIRTTDHVTFVRTLNGGAPGLEPTIVVTAGVGFTATFAVGDTSTYQWRIT